MDRIITKSISRFARNTVTLLTVVRDLRRRGIGIYFEEENIDTLSEAGELMITLLASKAQEESRATSENCKWRIKKMFEEGYTTHFVRYIYRSFMMGKTGTHIAKALTEAGIPTPGGKKQWQASTIMSILQNEKYKGAALLQKSFTVDFLEKRMKVNEGEVPQYYIEHSHEAIIDMTISAGGCMKAPIILFPGKRMGRRLTERSNTHEKESDGAGFHSGPQRFHGGAGKGHDWWL